VFMWHFTWHANVIKTWVFIWKLMFFQNGHVMTHIK
jgi:hypothetical protein